MKWTSIRVSLLFLSFFYLFLPCIGFTAFNINETFDTYATGSDLNGQGCWTTNSGQYTISGTEFNSTPYSAHNVGGTAIYDCSLSPTNDGDLYFAFFDVGDESILRLVNSGTYVVYIREQTGNIEYYNGSSYVSLGAVPNVAGYNYIGIRLDNAGHSGQAQYTIDGGTTWSSWDTTANGANTVDTIRIFGDYIDDICGTNPCTSSSNNSSSTTATTTSGTVVISNIGDITFGIAVLITLNSLMLIGFIYNRQVPKKKPWQKYT